MSLLDAFNDLDNQTAASTDKKVLRAPFGYPGGKSKSVKQILPLLPYRDAYIEPFGGSGAVLIARERSKLEVFNDRYAGVVAFYRCIRDATKLNALIDRLDLTVHSREEFVWCKATWEGCQDDVERAARWYYMTKTSFGQLSRNWGRATSAVARIAGIAKGKLGLFPEIHTRFRHVQIENRDYAGCLHDYDGPDAVFYLDPPYLGAYSGSYGNELTKDQHRELLNTVMDMQGFVAVSGFSNPLYDGYDWDTKYTWDVHSSIQGVNGSEGNNKGHVAHLQERTPQTECLWIKE